MGGSNLTAEQSLLKKVVQMLRGIQTLALAALISAVQGFELLKNEPIVLYNDVSPKLRIVAKDSAFNGIKFES